MSRRAAKESFAALRLIAEIETLPRPSGVANICRRSAAFVGQQAHKARATCLSGARLNWNALIEHPAAVQLLSPQAFGHSCRAIVNKPEAVMRTSLILILAASLAA